MTNSTASRSTRYFRVPETMVGNYECSLIPEGFRRRNAIALWTQAGAWCAANETFGWVPRSFPRLAWCSQKDAQALVDVGMWHLADDPCDTETCKPFDEKGYRFHNWSEHQVSEGKVYFAELGDYIKIGVTRNSVNARLSRIGKGFVIMPPGVVYGRPQLLAEMPGDRRTEQSLHARFAEHRVAGEWFARAPELLDFIAQVAQ